MGGERMTEADLQALEGGARARATEPETENVSAQMFLRVLTEVRRQRALIARVATLHDPDGSIDEDGRDYEQGICQWCGLGLEEGHAYHNPHVRDCPWAALLAEARAIREEQAAGLGVREGRRAPAAWKEPL